MVSGSRKSSPSVDADRDTGLFNPAVALGLAMIGAVTWVRCGLVIIAQILGAMSSAAVVSALFPGELNVSVTLGENTNTAQGLCESSSTCTSTLVGASLTSASY